MPVLDVLFEYDTLRAGAYGRNGTMKTKGLVVLEGSDQLAIPEVPYVELTPINGKGDVTETCKLRWPMHDTAAVIDAVLATQGFSAAKRKAVAGLLNDETEPKVDLEFDEPTPVTASYGDVHVCFEQDESGAIPVQVFCREREIHSFIADDNEVKDARQRIDEATINWESPSCQ